MFNFIQEKIREREAAIGLSDDHDDAALIVEYAHLFQELDDLSVEGNDADRTRKISIDIPVEDDIEIDTIELNLGDCRITDVPMDVTVQESNYSRMKTFEDFYQESATAISRFPRETDDGFEKRRMDYANKEFVKYKNYVIQEGLFGFDKIPLDDSRVPASLLCDFGQLSIDKPNQSYIVKLRVLYETDKKHRILKKQLDSLNNAVSCEAFVALGSALPNLLRSDYPDEINKIKNIWDAVTPVKLIVPIDPVDSYKVVVGFECEFADEIEYYSWTKPIKSTNRNKANEPTSLNKTDVDCNIAIANNVEKMDIKSKKDHIAESHEMRRPRRFGRFYQEAIDFGEGNGDNTPPPVDDGDIAASVEGKVNDDPSISFDDSSIPAESDQTTTDKAPVDTNDVSDQIAAKISVDTTQPDLNSDIENVDNVTDIPIDENIDTNDNINVNMSDDPTTIDVDQKLDGLDDAGNTDMGLDGSVTNIDVDNMTIDELLEQGAEKLKNMPIQQLKNFLASDSTLNNIDSIQESFILTKKNIKNEIDIHLRKALGILNSHDMKLAEIIKEFKRTGKKLNKALSKAYKLSDVFSEDDRKHIEKLNKCLVDLMTTLKLSNDQSYIANIKRLIKAFISESVVVAKIVENEKDGE